MSSLILATTQCYFSIRFVIELSKISLKISGQKFAYIKIYM